MQHVIKTGLKTGFCLAVLVGLSFASTRSAFAGGNLTGQSVQVSKRTPDKSTIEALIAAKTITSEGTTFLGSETMTTGNFQFVAVTVTPSQINIALIPPLAALSYGIAMGGSSSDPNFFDGIVVSEVGLLPANITGVSVDPSTYVFDFFSPPETFDISRVTFDSHNVFLNFQGIVMDDKSNVTLDLTTAPAAVPEASTTASFGLLLALGGVIVAAKRKKAGSVA